MINDFGNKYKDLVFYSDIQGIPYSADIRLNRGNWYLESYVIVSRTLLDNEINLLKRLVRRHILDDKSSINQVPGLWDVEELSEFQQKLRVKLDKGVCKELDLLSEWSGDYREVMKALLHHMVGKSATDS